MWGLSLLMKRRVGELLVAVDDEAEDALEVVDNVVRLIGSHDGFGFVQQILHGVLGILDAAVVLGKVDELLDVVVGEFGLVHEFKHLVVLWQLLLAECVDEGQGDFALSQVVAGGLADDGVVEVVEGVVLDLEAEPEQVSEALEVVKFLLGRIGGESAHFHTAGEEGGRLAANDAHVELLVDVAVLGILDLVDFANGEVGTKPGEHVQDSHIACVDSAFESSTHKVVAHEHGNVVVPNAVDGGRTATLLATVDDIIVNERGIVQQLDRGCSIEHLAGDTAKELAAEQYQDGPDLLALGVQVLGDDGVGQRAVAVEQHIGDELVQLVELRANGVLYVI